MGEEAGIPIKFDKKTQLPQLIDQRPLKLEYLIPIAKTQRFFEGLKEGKLFATKCEKCGTVYFPPQHVCPQCGVETTWIELSEEAELLTYTIINVKPKTFQHYQDYIIAIGETKEGAKVMAWLNAKKEEIKVGMKLKIVIKKREPEGYLVYEFEPA